MVDVKVVIVGAGPSGLAMSACLNELSIHNLVLEREDCSASLWKKRAYDRLHLHLAKDFCELPYLKFPEDTPTYMSKDLFISYLDKYASLFDVNPLFCRSVESAYYDVDSKKWRVSVQNTIQNVTEVYSADFLVVATGENGKGFIPKFPGLGTFLGDSLHSSEYKSGSCYDGKKVLVVGCGNSGMEIALDLSNYGAKTSIVIKSPLHFLTKEMVQAGMRLCAKYSVDYADKVVLNMANLVYGDLTAIGLVRPSEGPFFLKNTTGRSPVVDVGTIDKIKAGEINVVPAVSSIEKNGVKLVNGEVHEFDALIFATGYRSTANSWLKDYDSLMNDDGMPKRSFPNHWKGANGLYCVGFARRGLSGLSSDAESVASDIKLILSKE